MKSVLPVCGVTIGAGGLVRKSMSRAHKPTEGESERASEGERDGRTQTDTQQHVTHTRSAVRRR